MVPVATMEPGEYRLARMLFDKFPEIAYYGDSLSGAPTAPTVTIRSSPNVTNSGSLIAGTPTTWGINGPNGIQSEIRFTLDTRSGSDGDSWIVDVVSTTAGGSVLKATGQLLVKALP